MKTIKIKTGNSELAITRESVHRLCLAETQGRWGNEKNFIVERKKKGKAFSMPDWRLLVEEAGDWLTRSSVPCVVGLGNIFGFLQLVLSREQEAKQESWQPLTKSCPSGAFLYRSCGLASKAGCCRGWGPERRSIFIYGLTIVHLNIQSLSVISKIKVFWSLGIIKNIYLYKVWLGGNSPMCFLFFLHIQQKHGHLFFPYYFSRMFVEGTALKDIDSSSPREEHRCVYSLCIKANVSLQGRVRRGLLYKTFVQPKLQPPQLQCKTTVCIASTVPLWNLGARGTEANRKLKLLAVP